MAGTGQTIVAVAEPTPEYTRKSEGDVMELQDGRLLLVYMEFAGDGSDFAPTRLVAQESSDGGLTWGRHRALTETSPGDVNVYSPNLIRAADDALLLLFMRQHSVQPWSLTNHVWRSDDERESFRPHAEFVAGRDYALCNAVVKRLASGRLLLPANPADRGVQGQWGQSYAVAVLYSDDDGLTWQEAANRVRLPLRGAMEPHVEQTRDGRVLMVMRNQLGSLFMSESADGGLTWSLPQTTGLRTPESCPELTRIPATGDEAPEARRVEHAGHPEHLGLRQARELVSQVRGHVQRVRDHEQNGVRRHPLDVLDDLADDPRIDLQQVIARHAGPARDARGDHHQVRPGADLVGLGTLDAAGMAGDRRRLAQVQRLAARQTLHHVHQGDIRQPRLGDAHRRGRPDLSRSDDADSHRECLRFTVSRCRAGCCAFGPSC
jgi:hypothetical protein